MIPAIGMMIACYCMARLLLAVFTGTTAHPRPRVVLYAIIAISLTGAFGVGFYANEMLRAIPADPRPAGPPHP